VPVPSPVEGPGHPLGRLQRGLEQLYRIATGVDVGDFMVDAGGRDALAPDRRPREQLLVHETAGEVLVGLFICPDAVANLVRHDPGAALDRRNFGDFLLAVEGVSHFVLAVWCAAHGRAVTALELELQAEVDKYVTCLLASGPSRGRSEALRHRLFRDVDWEPDLDLDERDRYRAANDNAHRYATWLEEEFVASRRIPDMLAELRRFYRQPLARKLAVIAQAA
jgi:hypothetical protein